MATSGGSTLEGQVTKPFFRKPGDHPSKNGFHHRLGLTATYWRVPALVAAWALSLSLLAQDPKSVPELPPIEGALVVQQEGESEAKGTEEGSIVPPEGELASEISGRGSQLPIFGHHLFRIDVSNLSPGPIDPETYFISPKDELLLQIWGREQNSDHNLVVSSEHYVNIEEGKLGRVYLAGLTLAQARQRITRALSEVYSSFIDSDDPYRSVSRIELTPTKLHEIRFLVQGEVNQPGSYSLYPSRANLIYALARAQGVKDGASIRRVKIRRAGRSLVVDFYRFLLTGDLEQSEIQVQNGDVIFVPLKTQEVSIQGEVRRPGRYELKDNEGLLRLLKMAGDLKPGASLEKALILRTAINEGLVTLDFPLKDLLNTGRDQELKDQDVVNISSIRQLRDDYVSVEGGGVSLPGEYQLRTGMRISELVREAGDLTGQAYLLRADLIRTSQGRKRFYQKVDLSRAIKGEADHDLMLEPLDRLVVYTVPEIEGPEGVVNLSGHVKLPGEYELYRGMRLYDLLFAKGGFQDENHWKKTYISRGDIRRRSLDGSRELFKFDLKRLMEGQPEQNHQLQDLDEIVIYSVDEISAVKHKVTLTGHVKRPGEHSLFQGMTIYDLLDIAGGFQDRQFRQSTFLERADLIRWVRRGSELERTLIAFNLGALLLGDDSEDQPLQADDEIVVYAAKDLALRRMVAIDGFVKKPGVYEFLSSMTLADLLLQAGGLLEGAYARAEISRLDMQGNPSVKREIIPVEITDQYFNNDGPAGIPLKSNDRISVRKHPDFDLQDVVEIRGEVRVPGRYVLREGMNRVSDLVQWAGGLKEPAAPQAARLMRQIEPDLLPLENKLRLVQKEGRLTENGASRKDPATRPSERKSQTLEQKRIAFNLEGALGDPGSSQDLVLDDGDQLTIPRFENVVEVRGAVQFETAMAHVEGKGVEYYIDHAGGYSRDADSQGATLIYPDGRRVLNKGGFLWFKTLKVPPMSVIEVPLRPVVEESSEPVLEGPSNSGAETDSSQRDREKEPSLDNP